MDLPGRVLLREVGPRDGLQNEDPVPIDARIRLIDALSATGLARIEAVSFVHPAAVPQMAGAEEVWTSIARTPGVAYSALVPNLRGLDRALAVGCRDVEVVVSASDTHNRANVNRSTDQSLADLAPLAARAHEAAATVQIVVSTAFGCPYEGDVPLSRVAAVVDAAVAAGADSLCFGDTTGMGTPTRVERLVERVRADHPDRPISLHFHDTRGTGVANLLTALQCGVTEFDASVGGMGGCPYAPGASGNIATEEVVAMLADMGVETGVDLDALIGVAELAERIVGRTLPSQVLRAGPRTRTVPFGAAAAR